MVSLSTGLRIAFVFAALWFTIVILLLTGRIGDNTPREPAVPPFPSEQVIKVTATVTVTAQPPGTQNTQRAQVPVTPPSTLAPAVTNTPQQGSNVQSKEPEPIVVPVAAGSTASYGPPVTANGGAFDFLLGPKNEPSSISIPQGSWPRFSTKWKSVAAVVLAYNRPAELRRTLESLVSLKLRDEVKIYVSQDGYHEATAQVAQEFVQSHGVEFMQRDRTLQGHVRESGTAHLAQHYKSALQRVFSKGHELVIIAEDDMIFSPDFFWFFKQTAILLEYDPTLYCISTWNDNGQTGKAFDNKRIYRTGFFPGLGWMLSSELWAELEPQWPLDHWDWWMRTSPIHKGRECLAPEVARNYNIGAEGANMHKGDYERTLKNIVHNKEWVDLGDLEYLLIDRYKKKIAAIVASGTHVPFTEASNVWRMDASKIGESLAKHGPETQDSKVVVVPYPHEAWNGIATVFQIFNHPRGYHRFTLIFPFRGYTIVLADMRKSPYIKDKGLIEHKVGLKAVAGVKAKSCTYTCQNEGMRCDGSQFDYVNTCEQLAQKFPCQDGCKYVVGPDIPNYVDDPSDYQHHMCLITEEHSTCQASHRSTLRLCPCVP